MEYNEFVNSMKQIYDSMIRYLENENSVIENFQGLINQIDIQHYQNDKSEFKLILKLTNKISKNFHRYPLFLDKIKQILTHYEQYIKQTFTNSEIFTIFKNNKRIILLLLDMKILVIDQSITKLMLKKLYDLDNFCRRVCGHYCEVGTKVYQHILDKQYNYLNYLIYFLPEINKFLTSNERSKIEKERLKYGENAIKDFEKNRQIGENESYICQLIRQDLVEDFVAYANQFHQDLSGQIPHSIFETNRFLIKNKPTLIEYAAFFGSIQIFQFLRLNQVQMSPSLWLYAIHGKNPEIIHILEHDEILPDDKSYLKCFKESIKCHFNDLANYFHDVLMKQNETDNENNYNNNSISYGFQYHNYKYIQQKNVHNFQFIFYYASAYDYLTIVKILLNSHKVDINGSIILNNII